MIGTIKFVVGSGLLSWGLVSLLWLTSLPVYSQSIKAVRKSTQNPTSVLFELHHLSRDDLAVLKAGDSNEKFLSECFQVSVASIHAQPEVATTSRAMAGKYFWRKDVLVFEPMFPLQENLRYVANYYRRASDGGSESKAESSRNLKIPITLSFALKSRPPFKSTQVQDVFPSTEHIPENLLKFYIKFSGPMMRGRIYEHIHLQKESGEEVELPFLEIDEELWNPDFTRLTLFLDPGRIKRGVKPLEDIGPALRNGETYRLTLRNTWLDANGRPLAKTFVKRFRVVEADRIPPEPLRWTFSIPKQGSKHPLIVHLNEPVDYGMALRTIRVVDAAQRTVLGLITLGKSETEWVFKPDLPWQKGDYNLTVPTIIEDLAGNNPGKPFDVDTSVSEAKEVSADLIRISFRIGF